MPSALRFVRLCAALAAIVAVSSGCGGGNGPDREFDTLAKDFISFYLKANPTVATAVGEYRYDDRLEDMSAEAVEENIRVIHGYLDRVRAIDPGALSQERAIDAQVLLQNIELILMDLEEERSYRRNPKLYTDILANALHGVLNEQSVPLEERLDRIANRLDQFPRFVDQAIANLEGPPRLRTEIAIDVTKGLIAFLEEDVLRETDKASRMRERVRHSAVPAREALGRFQRFLENDLLNRSFGAIRLGDETFKKLFRLSLGTDMSPETMVAEAYRELDAVHDRMYRLAVPLYEAMTGERTSAAPDFGERRRVIATVLDDIARDHPAPQDLLAAYTVAYEEAEAFVRERELVELPKAPLRIIASPPFLRVTQVAASVPPGPFERDGNHYFMVTPVADDLSAEQAEIFMREYNAEMIRVVTIHEAMPGHYVQTAYANRSSSLVRSVFVNPAFSEGWAVYVNGLMLEEGFRGGDPRFALMAEKYYLRVVVNALLDSGMHRENMQEDEAIRLVVQEGFQDRSEAVAKWRRRVGVSPCYLSSYFVGAAEIRSLREDARRLWGERFTLKEFHDRLLESGSIAPKFVRERMLGSFEAGGAASRRDIPARR